MFNRLGSIRKNGFPVVLRLRYVDEKIITCFFGILRTRGDDSEIDIVQTPKRLDGHQALLEKSER